MAGLRTTAAIAVGAWSFRTARSGVPTWDATAFRAVHRLPGGLAVVEWLPMQAGALASPLVIGALLAARGDRSGGIRVAGTGAAAWAMAKALKRSVGRGRPGEHLPETVLRLGSADHGYGYPSGHAAVAAGIAATFPTAGRPWVTAGVTGLAGIVGLARIHVGAHYPLDVLGGWALGTALGDGATALEAWFTRAGRPSGRGG